MKRIFIIVIFGSIAPQWHFVLSDIKLLCTYARPKWAKLIRAAARPAPLHFIDSLHAVCRVNHVAL